MEKNGHFLYEFRVVLFVKRSFLRLNFGMIRYTLDVTVKKLIPSIPYLLTIDFWHEPGLNSLLQI